MPYDCMAAKRCLRPPAPQGSLRCGGLVGPLAARHWKAPFRLDPEGLTIWDANHERVLDVRGWGYLTGKGSLGLPDTEAEKIMEDLGQSVVRILNAQWPNIEVSHACLASPSLSPDIVALTCCSASCASGGHCVG